MAYRLLDRAKMYVTGTPGTGAITLGTAMPGFQSFSTAGVSDGDTFPYVIEDQGGSWETGLATYTASSGTVARTLRASSTGSLLNATSAAVIYCSPGGVDLLAAIAQQQFTGDGATTSFTINNGYTPGTLMVFLNGVKQQPADITQTDGAHLVFAIAPPAGSTVDVYGYRGLATTPCLPTAGGVVTGPVTLQSTLQFLDGTQFSTAQSLGMRNRLINGDMRIDQRNAGASATPTVSSYCVVDRWALNFSQASKLTVGQSLGAVTPPTGFTKYLGVSTAAAYAVAAGDNFYLAEVIEGSNIADLGWGTATAQAVTLSFWVRSSLTGTFGGSIRNGGATRSYPFTYSIPVANTWTYVTVTVPGDTSGTWATDNTAGLIVYLGLGAGTNFSGAAGAWASGNYVSATGAVSVVGTLNATFYATGVQLEPGSTATPFERRQYGVELALCQRYYAAPSTVGLIAYNTSGIGGYVAWPQVMRTTPTIVFSSGGTVNNVRTTSNGVAVTVSTSALGATANGIAYIGSSTAVFTAGQAYDFSLTLNSEF